MKPSFKDRTPPTDSQIRDYFQILKQDSKSRVFAALAEALIRRGRLTEAEDICRLGLETNPEFSDGHLAHARVLFYLFRYQEAFEEVKVALGLYKDNTEAYLIAAEIFLARSQHKSASEACLKVIDLDPENQQARKILKRVGADEQVKAKKSEKETPTRMSTNSFKATAGTSPGRRAMKLGGKSSLSDPFRQLLHEAGEQASRRLDQDEQPFSAISSGSQPPVPSDLFDEKLDVLTKRKKSPRRPDGTPIPKLPDHPPTPVPVAERTEGHRTLERIGPLKNAANRGSVATPVGVPEAAPTPSPSGSSTSGMQMIDQVQAVIDSYADQVATDPYDHRKPPKIPRSGRILTLLGLLALLTAIGFAIVYGLRSEIRRGIDAATESRQAGSSLLLTDAAPIEPSPPFEEVKEEEKTEGATIAEPPEIPLPEKEVEPGVSQPSSQFEGAPEKVKPKKRKRKRRKSSKRKKRKKRRRKRRR